MADGGGSGDEREGPLAPEPRPSPQNFNIAGLVERLGARSRSRSEREMLSPVI